MPSKIISTQVITNKIYFIRGQKVILANDLAKLYGVSVKRLNEQVKRNRERFPDDFMFQLNGREQAELVANCDQFKTLKHSSVFPYAFTEQGVSMLSSVLNGKKAVEINIAIMRAFVNLRETLSLHKELSIKLKELEHKVEGNSEAIHAIFDAIRRLMTEEAKPKRKIGFH